jgi:hypothetical protein
VIRQLTRMHHRLLMMIVTATVPLAGCTVNLGSDAGSDTTDTSGDGDGDGDPSGDGDGDAGDGDGDTGPCPEGQSGCPCYGNDTCDPGLECNGDGICEPAGGDGDGDGDGDPGDGDPGDGDPGDGDGDGDLCGNGDIDLGEDCDDANADNGDGCNDDCTDSGALLWQEVFPVLLDDDFARGVAVDSSDRIFVTGFTRVLDNNIDGWYRKYSPDGQLFWDETFGGPEHEGANQVAVNPDDEILIAGWLHNGVNMTIDAMLRKIDQNGAEIWTRQFELLSDDTAFDVAVAADGTMVVTGGSPGIGWLRRYDADGIELWTQTFDNIGPRGREVDYTADGNIAVAIDSGRCAQLYTTAGDLVWTYLQNSCMAVGLAIDDNDVLLAGCETGNPSSAWFGRLDPDGILLWDETWVGESYASAEDIAVDSAGRIIAVGQRRVQNQVILATTRKYSSDGQTLIWEQTLQGAKVDGVNAAVSVTIDSEDNVIVVGTAEQDADLDGFVVKYGP